MHANHINSAQAQQTQPSNTGLNTMKVTDESVNSTTLRDGIVIVEDKDAGTFLVISIHGRYGRSDEASEVLERDLSCAEAARYAQDQYRWNVADHGDTLHHGSVVPKESYEQLGLIERVLKMTGYDGDAHQEAHRLETALQNCRSWADWDECIPF